MFSNAVFGERRIYDINIHMYVYTYLYFNQIVTVRRNSNRLFYFNSHVLLAKTLAKSNLHHYVYLNLVGYVDWYPPFGY